MLTQLQNRVSNPNLGLPAPDQNQLLEAYKAANRAPDHALLKPWRFIEIRDQAREQLGELFVIAAMAENQEPPNAAQQQKMRHQPLRAPLLIVAIANCSEHPKVPVIEQHISAGIACHQLALALNSQGFASMWRTGAMAYSAQVKNGLGLANNEVIIGFLYIGTALAPNKLIRPAEIENFVSVWPAQ